MSDQQERARMLRASGLTYTAIANEVGVSSTTVYRWLSPTHAEQSREYSRAWKRTHREANRARDREFARKIAGRCTDCGGSMGAGVDTDGTCRDCRSSMRLARQHQIQDMWLEGAKREAITKALGKNMSWLSTEMDHMRKTGWHLPRRAPFTGRWVEEVAA